MGDVLTAEEVTEMRQRVESGKIPEQGNVLILLSTCEQLRARLERVEKALRECDAVLARAQSGDGFPKDSEAWPESIRFWKAVDTARKAVAAALGAAGEKESTDG